MYPEIFYSNTFTLLAEAEVGNISTGILQDF